MNREKKKTKKNIVQVHIYLCTYFMFICGQKHAIHTKYLLIKISKRQNICRWSKRKWGLYIIYDRHQKTNEGLTGFAPSQDAFVTDEKLELQLLIKDLIHFARKTHFRSSYKLCISKIQAYLKLQNVLLLNKWGH